MTEDYHWEGQAFCRRLVASRIFTTEEKALLIQAYPLSDEMQSFVERVMWAERRRVRSILGKTDSASIDDLREPTRT